MGSGHETKTVSLRLKLFLMILIIGCIYVRVAKFEFDIIVVLRYNKLFLSQKTVVSYNA